MVGCVIVDESGEKVGEGFHPQPGKPHAEIYALSSAGTKAQNSTAYVTLEPCSHHGRTPPCADALIAAGIKRVVVAMADPDHRVSGRGIKKLAEAGIVAEVGVLESESRRLNRSYIHHRLTGLPYVTVKIAMTLDGKTATGAGDSKWITGPRTRQWVHRQLRDRTDAILVGVTTILKDDPLLTTRIYGGKGRDPIRIVLDSNLRTPLTSNVVKQSRDDGKTIVACLTSAAEERGGEYADRGVSILPMKADNKGRIDLNELMQTLGTKWGLSSVLIEGGATVIASAVEEKLVSRYIATVAPKLIGGYSAPGAIGGDGLASTMKNAVQLSSVTVRRSVSDLVIDALICE